MTIIRIFPPVPGAGLAAAGRVSTVRAEERPVGALGLTRVCSLQGSLGYGETLSAILVRSECVDMPRSDLFEILRLFDSVHEALYLRPKRPVNGRNWSTKRCIRVFFGQCLIV